MANNKVQLSNGTVIIDLTSDTVTSASHIKSGLVGHLADGTTATGTLVEKDVKSVTYNLSGGATASISTSEVVTGQGFSVKLKAPTGYSLSGVTVTMGGNDITSQVFTPDAEGGGGGGGSVTVTEEVNATGITCVITTGSEPTPPTPSGDWETLYDDTTTVNPDTPYNLFWIGDLADLYPTDGSVWRITIDSVEYNCTATTAQTSVGNIVCIGNPKYSGGTDDGSTVPFNFYNRGWGGLVGDTEMSATSHTLKIEQLIEA